MMRRSMCAACALAVLLAITACAQDSEEARPDARSSDGRVIEDGAGSSGPATKQEDSGSPGLEAAAESRLVVVDLFADVPTTRDGMPLEDDPFLAGSREEQKWLDRNGYPNRIQLEKYSLASDYMLEQAASNGDTVADVVLQGRRLIGNQSDLAAERLMELARNGSGFALSTLSAFMAGSSEGSPEIGYALSRVAEMRGDSRMALGRDAMFRRPLTPEQKLQGEAEAFRIFNEMRSSSKIGKAFVDPRPVVFNETEGGI